jgi:hypothetical protein
VKIACRLKPVVPDGLPPAMAIAAQPVPLRRMRR